MFAEEVKWSAKGIRPSRVLHVLGGMDRGGAETMIMNYYRNIDRSIMQFDFLCMSDGEHHYDEEIRQLGGKIIHIRGAKEAGALGNIRDIKNAIQDYGPFAAVHAHTLHHAGLVLLAARFAGIKRRISHAHSTSSHNENKLYRKIYFGIMRWLIQKNATKLLACGEAAGRYLYGDKKYDDGEVIILPLALDLSLYRNLTYKDKIKKREELSIQEDTTVIGHVGRFAEPKNHMFFIPLVQELVRRTMDFKLVLVGDGLLRKEFEREVIDKGLEDQIMMLGIRSDIPELMNMFDVFVLPSLYEGLPVVLIEAQAAGLPCLISDTITTEVDMGLELVRHMSLDASFEEWSDSIKLLVDIARPNHEARELAFTTKGYDIRNSVNMLYELYEIIS